MRLFPRLPLNRARWQWAGAGCLLLVTALTVAFWLQPAQVAAASEASGGDVWGADYFPNVELTDQYGKKHRFFSDLVKDKVVSINTFFTSCSASCGLETARIREVQFQLGDRVGKDVFFYSISIDPLTDTPEAMKAYAKRFNADPSWLFLTGSVKDTELIRRKLGLFDDEDAKNTNKNDHMLHSMIGNQKTGRWMRASPFENPNITATQLGSWLHNYKTAESAETRFENAPQYVRTISSGEQLFRTRCAGCHSVNGGDTRFISTPKVGPDLQGVMKRRQRAWLVRWLKEPDKMLAEKDPIAMQLFMQYEQIAMPNLRLDPKQVDQLIAFVDEESKLPADGKRLRQ